MCKQYDGFCRTAPRYGVILTSGGGMFFRNRRQHRTLPALHTQACEFEKIVRQVDFAASVGVRPQHALRKSSPIRDYVQRSSQQHPPARFVDELLQRKVRPVGIVIVGVNLVDAPQCLCDDVFAHSYHWMNSTFRFAASILMSSFFMPAGMT